MSGDGRAAAAGVAGTCVTPSWYIINPYVLRNFSNNYNPKHHHMEKKKRKTRLLLDQDKVDNGYRLLIAEEKYITVGDP